LIKKGAGIFLKNLPLNWSENDLQNKFKLAGSIFDVQLKFDKSGNSRGLAIILYDDNRTANLAIKLFNGQTS